MGISVKQEFNLTTKDPKAKHQSINIACGFHCMLCFDCCRCVTEFA